MPFAAPCVLVNRLLVLLVPTTRYFRHSGLIISPWVLLTATFPPPWSLYSNRVHLLPPGRLAGLTTAVPLTPFNFYRPVRSTTLLGPFNKTRLVILLANTRPVVPKACLLAFLGRITCRPPVPVCLMTRETKLTTTHQPRMPQR